MPTLETGHTTPRGVLDAARSLAPAIAARAGEVEARRRVPPDLLDDLVGAGVFRILRPTTHGGAEADLAGAMRLFESLARADASVAWTVMIGSGSWRDLVSLPRDTFDEILCSPDVITAGAFAPSGRSVAAEGGHLVSGRWAFASGCEHADWIYGTCVEGVADGVPQLRTAVFAPDQVEIEDTWAVSGLCGTGSHHFRADSVVVSPDRTIDRSVF
ncbi:MAG: acyl-CoA dehydrogenase family protein, partial [Miltoncostaeaceae bacterium]